MKKHKGFTLIELLIVIVVMGILASMMMLSSSESVSTARANNIISSLRNFSMAAMAFYTDSMDHFGKTPNTPEDIKSYAKKRMHNEGDIPDEDKYEVKNNSGTWWAGYNLESENSRVREKLEGRASSAKLYGTGSVNTFPTKNSNSNTYTPAYTKDYSYVWVLIRSNRR